MNLLLVGLMSYFLYGIVLASSDELLCNDSSRMNILCDVVTQCIEEDNQARKDENYKKFIQTSQFLLIHAQHQSQVYNFDANLEKFSCDRSYCRIKQHGAKICFLHAVSSREIIAEKIKRAKRDLDALMPQQRKSKRKQVRFSM